MRVAIETLIIKTKKNNFDMSVNIVSPEKNPFNKIKKYKYKYSVLLR